MTWLTALAWIAALWLAAGLEVAWGGGMPGPLLLVALAAGLWSGARAGLIMGAAAGLCDAALFGGSVLHLGLLGMACGGAAGLLTPWLSRHHLLVGLFTALAVSLLVGLLLGWPYHTNFGRAVLAALGRSGENLLWMIPIYGMVLVVSRAGNRDNRIARIG